MPEVTGQVEFRTVNITAREMFPPATACRRSGSALRRQEVREERVAE